MLRDLILNFRSLVTKSSQFVELNIRCRFLWNCFWWCML